MAVAVVKIWFYKNNYYKNTRKKWWLGAFGSADTCISWFKFDAMANRELLKSVRAYGDVIADRKDLLRSKKETH